MDERMNWAESARYLAGEASVAERAQFEAWMAADPARAALVDSLRVYMAERPATAPPMDIELAWQTLDARTRDAAPQVLRNRRDADGLNFNRLGWSLAAAALLLAAAIGTWVFGHGPSQAAGGRQWATANGQRMTVTLEGGTRAVLAPATTMIITATGGVVRSVRLTGEAYFTVAHDIRRQFAVFTSGAVVRDVGTKFSVRAFRRSPRTEVVVAEGAVEMRSTISGSDTAGLLVHAGETAFSESGKLSSARPANLQRSFGWLRGELVFVDAPLVQVASDLERWYGTPVRVEGENARSRSLTVTFAGESLSQALDAIARTLDVRYARDPSSGAIVIQAR